MIIKKIILILSIIVIVLSCYISSYIEKRYRQVEFGINNNYLYIVLSDSMYKYNTYLNYANKTYFAVNNEKIIAFILMETQSQYNDEAIIYTNNIVEGQYDILTCKEVAISKNLSDSLKLKIANSIYFNNESTGKFEEYKIKYIFKDAYGIYKTDVNNHYGIILMGFNKEYANNINTQKIISISNIDTILNKIPIEEIYIKDINYYYFPKYILVLMVFLIVSYSLLYISLFRYYRKFKYEDMIIYGCSKRIIKLNIVKDFAAFYFISITIILIFASLTNIILNSYASLFSIIILLPILLIPIIIISFCYGIILNKK